MWILYLRPRNKAATFPICFTAGRKPPALLDCLTNPLLKFQQTWGHVGCSKKQRAMTYDFWDPRQKSILTNVLDGKSRSDTLQDIANNSSLKPSWLWRITPATMMLPNKHKDLEKLRSSSNIKRSSLWQQRGVQGCLREVAGQAILLMACV